MKKNNITQLIILLLPNILWFTSCYEDKSSFVTNLIPEVQISINDKNQENSIYVGYQSPVDIVPSITQDGFDGSNLRYEWAVTEEPSTSNPVYEIIGFSFLSGYLSILNKFNIDTISVTSISPCTSSS